MKKVLVIWYDIFEYLESIANAFKANGIDADKFVIEHFSTHVSLMERVANNIGVKCFKQKHNRKMRDQIIAKCERDRIDHILVLNGNFPEILDDTFFAWAGANGVNLSLWFIDSARKFSCFSQEYFRKFGYIYSFEPLDLPHLAEQYDTNNVQYLPLGADDEMYNSKGDQEKEYDVCFVGASSEKRKEILEAVAKYCEDNNKKMIVYGQLWRFKPWIHRVRHERKFKKQYPHLHKVVVNRYLNSVQIAELYKKSRICLNIVQAVHSAANPRTFEILATNSFQLVDYHPTIEKLLKNGEHMVMYKDKEDAVRLIDFYLKHDVERVNIARAGLVEVQERFLLKELVKMIIRDNN